MSGYRCASSPGTSTTGASRCCPTDTRRAAWEHLASVHRRPGRARPGGRAAARARRATGRSTARSPGTGTGARRSSRSTRQSRSSRSARCAIPWSRRRFLLANTHPGSVAVAPADRARHPADHARERLRRVGRVGRCPRCSGSSPTSCRCSTRRYGCPGHPRRRLQRLDGHEGPEVPRPRGGRARGDPLARPRRGEVARRRAPGVVARLLRAAAAGRATTSPTWGRAELDHLFVSPVARRPGDGALRRPGGRRGRPVRPRAARPRPRALRGAHAPHLGRGVVRRGDRPPARPGRPRGHREARVSWADQKERELATATGVVHQDPHPLPDQRLHDRARAVVPGGPQPRAPGHPVDDLDPRGRATSSSGSAACATRRSTRTPPATSCARRSTRWTASTSTVARSTAGRGSRSRSSRTRPTSRGSSPCSTGSRPRATRLPPIEDERPAGCRRPADYDRSTSAHSHGA